MPRKLVGPDDPAVLPQDPGSAGYHCPNRGLIRPISVQARSTYPHWLE